MLAAAIREAAVAGQPILVTGCGTSEHAAVAGVEILRDALRTAGLPTSTLAGEQALELSLDPVGSGLVVDVPRRRNARDERGARRVQAPVPARPS